MQVTRDLSMQLRGARLAGLETIAAWVIVLDDVTVLPVLSSLDVVAAK